MAPIDTMSTNASYVRQNWSTVIDSVVHEKPAFIKRTHDNLVMMDMRLLQYCLLGLTIHVTFEREDDGSITGGVDELDLFENAPTKDLCLDSLIFAMRDYAQDFYNEFELWSSGTNRKPHIPYVLKILISDDDMLRGSIVCQDGAN